MSLYTILLIIQYIGIAITLFMCIYIMKKLSRPLHSWLFFYCVSTLGNNAGYLAVMLSKTGGEAILAWQFSYLFRVWIPFGLLMFVLLLCKGKRYSKITSVLAIIHALTYFFVLTMKHNTLYYTSFDFVESGIFPHVVHTNGIWHYLYDLLIISYAVVGFPMLFRALRQQKKSRKKKQLTYMTAAIITDCVFYILEIFHTIPGYDMTALGFTISGQFLFIAIFVYDILDTKELARDFVIEQVSEGIIAVNEDGSVNFFNEKAKKLLPDITDSPESVLTELNSLIQAEKPLEVQGKKYTPKENVLGKKKSKAGKIYILTDDTKHYQYAEKLTREMMHALSKAVDAKDHYTNGHSGRVALYSKEIARRMGKTEEEQEQIYEMGLLHDIGKIGVSEEIINKTTRLTNEEFSQIKTHTLTGWSILHQISAMPELAIGARSHHEKFNGTGYPDGLKGTDIPEAARIICVADCYDAMTSTRTYSSPKTQESVRAEFERCSGTQFDPDIAKVMIAMIDDDTEFKMNEHGTLV